ncbi:transcriptional regulator, partial [Pantoea sp. UBA5923]
MSLLLKVKPLVISPILASRIGLNEAIVLQQICYWLEDTTAGVDYDGRRWVYNSINAWNEQFPWWTGKTIQRTVSSLKKMGLIYVEQLKKKQHDQTNYYAINYVSPLLADTDNLSLSRKTNCPDPKGQSVPMEKDNLSPSIGSTCPSLTENTTENTTEITTRDSCQVAAQPDREVELTDQAKKVLSHLNQTTGAKF